MFGGNSNRIEIFIYFKNRECSAVLQQERRMDRRTYTSTSIYPDDLKVIDDFCKRKELKNRAEGLRIAIQYANAHGALK
jgi:hypothetical protein